MDLLEKLQINQSPLGDDDSIDRKTCVLSTRLQLYCSIIGSCFVLRKQIWFNLIDLCCNQIQLESGEFYKDHAFQLNLIIYKIFPEKVYKIIRKLCSEIFNMEPSTLLEDDIPNLIGRCVQKDYPLILFPWQLTRCQSHTDFLQEYTECITLNIILYKSNLLQDLVQMMGVRSLSDLLTMVSSSNVQIEKIFHNLI